MTQTVASLEKQLKLASCAIQLACLNQSVLHISEEDMAEIQVAEGVELAALVTWLADRSERFLKASAYGAETLDLSRTLLEQYLPLSGATLAEFQDRIEGLQNFEQTEHARKRA